MARKVPCRSKLSAPTIAETIQSRGGCFGMGLAKPCILARVSRRFDADALFLPPPI
jgi:hypothetical protein